MMQTSNYGSFILIYDISNSQKICLHSSHRLIGNKIAQQKKDFSLFRARVKIGLGQMVQD